MTCVCQNVAAGCGLVASGIKRGLAVIEHSTGHPAHPHGGYIVYYRGPMAHAVFEPPPWRRTGRRLTWAMVNTDGSPFNSNLERNAAEAWRIVQRVAPIIAEIEAAAAERCVFPVTHAAALDEVRQLRERVAELETILTQAGRPSAGAHDA